MTTLAVCDANAGTIARYEVGGEVVRKTHAIAWGKPVIFTPAVVEEFRVNPPDSCSLTPAPTPTPPNAGAGTGGGPANDEVVDTAAVARAA